MTTKTTAKDPRTETQQKQDEAIASGDWTGFETEELLTEKGALQLLAHAKKLTSDPSLASSGVYAQPFRWKNKVYRILRCEFIHGEALVEVAPHDEEFVVEIRQRLQANRFHHLAYCQGFGFACFPEDYAKYRD